MDISIARNRLSKVEKVRRSANELEARGDLDGAATLRSAAQRNEAEVWNALANSQR